LGHFEGSAGSKALLLGDCEYKVSNCNGVEWKDHRQVCLQAVVFLLTAVVLILVMELLSLCWFGHFKELLCSYKIKYAFRLNRNDRSGDRTNVYGRWGDKEQCNNSLDSFLLLLLVLRYFSKNEKSV
jgi:small-conductance mechanosensitive channel